MSVRFAHEPGYTRFWTEIFEEYSGKLEQPLTPDRLYLKVINAAISRIPPGAWIY